MATDPVSTNAIDLCIRRLLISSEIVDETTTIFLIVAVCKSLNSCSKRKLLSLLRSMIICLKITMLVERLRPQNRSNENVTEIFKKENNFHRTTEPAVFSVETVARSIRNKCRNELCSKKNYYFALLLPTAKLLFLLHILTPTPLD